MDKENVLYIHDEELFSLKKKYSALNDRMNKPGGHYTK
jgi:hypothetical protein